MEANKQHAALLSGVRTRIEDAARAEIAAAVKRATAAEAGLKAMSSKLERTTAERDSFKGERDTFKKRNTRQADTIKDMRNTAAVYEAESDSFGSKMSVLQDALTKASLPSSGPPTVDVACEAPAPGDLLRGPKDKLRLTFDSKAHGRAVGAKRKRAAPTGSGEAAPPELFAVGSSRLLARALEHVGELLLVSVKAAGIEGVADKDATGQVRVLRRAAAAGVTGIKNAEMDEDARRRHEQNRAGAARDRADRHERWMHQRLPTQKPAGGG